MSTSPNTSARTAAILRDLASTLRTGAGLAQVSLGASANTAAMPRASVDCEAMELQEAPGEPSPATWAALHVKIGLVARISSAGEAATRGAELCQQIADRLLADPTRGGNCEDLPIGPPTQIVRWKLLAADSSTVTAETIVRCHFEIPVQSTGTITLDGQSLFASGPCSLTAGAWMRQLCRRKMPGLDGELVLDMGVSARPITQTGTLRADTAAALAALMQAVEALADGATHTLVDPAGMTYANAMLEAFEPSGPIRQWQGCSCQYTCRYLQLPGS